MKTRLYTIDDLNVDLKTIIQQIKLASFSPELVLSINRGGCIPGIYLSETNLHNEKPSFSLDYHKYINQCKAK